MLTSDSDDNLVKQIRSSVSEILYHHTNKQGDLELSNVARVNILRKLLHFSKQIPHPGQQRGPQDSEHSPTLTRWQVLAYVASIDLTIAKWFESHLDALSILREMGFNEPMEGLWAVWAAEGLPLDYHDGILEGAKAWCSGANLADHGLMTYRDARNQSQLLIIDMQQDGIRIDDSRWHAVGMQHTDTATIHFSGVRAQLVGKENAYLHRAGFWHGAAGVAACWYGAAASLSTYLRESYEHKPNDFKAMYLGEISAALVINRQYFNALAVAIDDEPRASHELAVGLLRVNVEKLAREVIQTVGQALGATPFCSSAHFSRLSADLQVFIRQTHGAFDFKRLGEMSNASIEKGSELWQL